MPGGRGNIKPKDNPKPFKKGNKANPKGRPKKTIGVINEELESEGYVEASKPEIVSCYLRLINTDIPQIEKLIKQRTQPALVRIIGKAILSGKGFDVIESMLDRSIGKAMQQMELSGNPDRPLGIPKVEVTIK